MIELVEAVGLWTARRWGEYFAMVATSVGLPLEIYDLTRKVTATTIVLLIINLALVVYLAVTKRLFGVRGGKIAYDARLREESVLEAAREAADRSRSAAPHGAHGAATGQPGAPQSTPDGQWRAASLWHATAASDASDPEGTSARTAVARAGGSRQPPGR